MTKTLIAGLFAAMLALSFGTAPVRAESTDINLICQGTTEKETSYTQYPNRDKKDRPENVTFNVRVYIREGDISIGISGDDRVYPRFITTVRSPDTEVANDFSNENEWSIHSVKSNKSTIKDIMEIEATTIDASINRLSGLANFIYQIDLAAVSQIQRTQATCQKLDTLQKKF